jgi:hypothetical protein
MPRERLGVLRAAVIIFVTGVVVGALMTLFVPVAWLSQFGGYGPKAAAPDTGTVVTSMALVLLLHAIAVVIGVRLSGFRVGVIYTTFALGITTAITLGIVYVTMGAPSGDPTSVAAPSIGVVVLPVVLAIGLVLPALLIDGAARPALDHLPPELRYVPHATYPPELPPPQPRR